MRVSNPPKGALRDARRGLAAWRRRLGYLARVLDKAYRSPRLGNVQNATDELFYIFLSNRTAPSRYVPAFREMRRRYRPWSALLGARRSELEQLFRPLGLEKVRAERALGIARRLETDLGTVSVERLRSRPMNEVLTYLTSLPGIGEKSARCVAMYSFGHDVTPVDAHQLRVMVRYGLLPPGTSASAAHALLDDRLPPGIARRLHVNAVAHGRAVCAAQRPKCAICPVERDCLKVGLDGSSGRRIESVGWR
jgi:endonuclease III